jgi:hypothetical protein
VAGSSFYDAGALKQLAINLFYGWGYNFYRKENQLRTDDLLVRGKVSETLGMARASVEAAESDYRREFLPPPTRAQPFPPGDTLKNAQTLERLTGAISALATEVHAQPAPENDFILRRLRDEAATLAELLERDQQLAGQAELLRSTLHRRDAAWILNNLAAIREGIQAITETLRARQKILLIR